MAYLQGFVHEEWVSELDFSTLEKVSGSYVSNDLRAREENVIWRVKYQQSWIYVYLLTFQKSHVIFGLLFSYTRTVSKLHV